MGSDGHGDQRVPASASSATDSMLVSSTNDGPVDYRLPTTDHVLVGQVQPQRVDGEIALQKRLLIDGPLHGPFRIASTTACVGIERRHPGVAVGLADGFQRANATGAPSVRIRSMPKSCSQLGDHGAFDGRLVHAVDVEILGSAVESLRHSGTSGFKSDVTGFVDHAQASWRPRV